MKGKIMKQEKGITLIALVITIIVLLILAGVAISMLSGENGILTRASDASDQTKKASTEEQIELAVTEAMLRSTDYTKIESETALKDALVRQGVTETTVTPVEGGYTVKVGAEEYKVYSNGTTKAKSIVTDITAINYGDVITGYEVNGVSDWKVFYNDGNNVWIMASDYVQLDSETATVTGMTTSGYKAYWSSAPSGEKKVNEKCVETLSNTENWKKYVDKKLATKAMGGPTLEMFAKSYNAKYSDKKQIEYTNKNIDYNWYKVKWDSDSDYAYYIGGLENDGFYYLSDTKSDSIYAYWLASPSAYSSNDVMRVGCDGGMGNYYFSYNGSGVRPVICLKSDIQVTSTISGDVTTWSIQQ